MIKRLAFIILSVFLINLVGAVITIEVAEPNGTIQFWEGGRNFTLLTNLTGGMGDTYWYSYDGVNSSFYIVNDSFSFTDDNNNGFSLSASTIFLSQTIPSRGFAISIDGPSTGVGAEVGWRMNGNPQTADAEGSYYRSTDSGTTWSNNDAGCANGTCDFHYQIINNATVLIEGFRTGSPGTINIRIIGLNETNGPNSSLVYSSRTFDANSLTTSTSGEVYGVTGSFPVLTNFTIPFNITEHINTTLVVAGNETDGSYFGTTTTWDYDAFLNNVTINNTFYETSFENFIASFTLFKGLTFSALEFLYDEVSQTLTQTGTGNVTVSTGIDIPLGIGQKDFGWNFSLSNGKANLTNSTITVDPINLTLCETSPLDVPFINFTYRNETTNEEVTNASVTSTWEYYLSSGDGQVNKTLSFSDSAESLSHAFCFSPADRTAIVDLSYNYDNAESQQRTYTLRSATLTNSTIDQILYLLPTDLGLFSKFQVIDNTGNPLQGVTATISRNLGGSTITISSAQTDSSGFVNFFLNPDVTYTATFSLSGFADNTFSFVPSSDLRTVTMGGGTSNIGNGTTIANNLTYTINPANTTLNNNTIYAFEFIVAGNTDVDLISMNITNSSGFELLYSENAGVGTLSGNLDTGSNTTFIGTFRIESEGEEFSVRKIWRIGENYIGEYSIFKQWSLFTGYGFRDFIKILLAVSVIISLMIFLSTNELIESTESKIIIALLLVWAFSLVGWLDTGLVVNSAQAGINDLGQFSSKYGIAILSTGAGAFFIFRRLFN